MNKNHIKYLSVILLLTLLISLFSSCNDSNMQSGTAGKTHTSLKNGTVTTAEGTEKHITSPTPEAGLSPTPVSTPEQTPSIPVAEEPESDILPVGSSEELYRIIVERCKQGGVMRGGDAVGSVQEDIALTSGSAGMAQSNAAETGAVQNDDFSSTNIQVKGVDESDIVKTDGEYIYQVKSNKIVTIKANPSDDMKIVSAVDFPYANYNSAELYIDGDMLVVMAKVFINKPYLAEIRSIDSSTGQAVTTSQLQYYSESAVKVLIYNMSDRTNLELVRNIEIDGSYISSRKVGKQIYIVTNKGAFFRFANSKPVPEMPVYFDTAVAQEPVYMDTSNIFYFKDQDDTSYMITASIDLNNISEQVKLAAYLGAGSTIYVSSKNLYVAAVKSASVQGENAMPYYQQKTMLYKFALDGPNITYTAKGEVPGSILNQFSMDENEGYFRIAATTNGVLNNEQYTTISNMYVLDENMQITGKIENIAPGERIYSVRFMGGRAYMVTYRSVDPLFVISLTDPSNPQILGELKIPGYSNYLHPYDEDHIIGFGKDAVEVLNKDGNGNVVGSNAFYQGMKIALFDVSDVNNPVQEFSEVIGDRGTDSELLQNHKALLFSRDKNLLAFPVTLYEINKKTLTAESSQPPNITQYGEFTFQGAYIYNLDLLNGFSLKGRITNMDPEDYNKFYNPSINIRRILYISDTLYAISDSIIKAATITDLTPKGQVNIP